MDGTVLFNKELMDGTVPSNKELVDKIVLISDKEVYKFVFFHRKCIRASILFLFLYFPFFEFSEFVPQI